MKTILIVIITAVLTWVTFEAILGVRTGADRMWMKSAIKVPGEMALRDIQAEMKAGRHEPAMAKVDAFVETWRRFSSGPDSCSGAGIGDIMVVFSKIPSITQQTNLEPDGAANGSQPIRSETNRTSSAAGSRR